MGRLVIDGNRVYELDEECLKRKKVLEHQPTREQDGGKQNKRGK